MSIDFDAAVLAPIYQTLGVSATLTTQSPAGGNYAVTVIDNTAGGAVDETVRAGHIAIESIRPVAVMRQAELAALGLILMDLEGADLKIRDVTWRIKAYQVKPSPSGDGEIKLILLDEDP